MSASVLLPEKKSLPHCPRAVHREGWQVLAEAFRKTDSGNERATHGVLKEPLSCAHHSGTEGY
jgi:hypothetical protein